MKWPKYLDKYPLSTIADFVGVSEKSVAKWRKDGIPKARLTAIRAIKSRVHVSAYKQTLRKTEVGILLALLDMAGTPATRAQVQKWKREREIPLKFRVFLVDAHLEERPKKEPKKKESVPAEEKPHPCLKFTVYPIQKKESHNYIIELISWDINRKLTNQLMIELFECLSTLDIERGKQQFRILGTVEMQFADSDILNYALGKIVPTDTEAEVDAWTPQYSKYSLTLKGLLRRLGEYVGMGLFIEKLGLQIVTNKKVVGR